MVNKIKYYKPYIPKRLQKFFDRYKTTIDSLFEILQSFKPDIPVEKKCIHTFSNRLEKIHAQA